MQLSRTLPETTKKLEEGKVILSQINMLAALLNSDEKFAKKEQRDILEKIEDKSKEQTKEILDSVRKKRGIKVKPKRSHIKDESNETVRLSVSLSKKNHDQQRYEI